MLGAATGVGERPDQSDRLGNCAKYHYGLTSFGLGCRLVSKFKKALPKKGGCGGLDIRLNRLIKVVFVQ